MNTRKKDGLPRTGLNGGRKLVSAYVLRELRATGNTHDMGRSLNSAMIDDDDDNRNLNIRSFYCFSKELENKM